MAKSQQTFNKEEKEKQRLRKRQEKEQKKEDRKAHGGKAKNLDEMLAYVDENGNITSTPPDIRKKTVIEQDSIAIGVPKQAPADPADNIHRGVVTFFNDSKGYGFHPRPADPAEHLRARDRAAATRERKRQSNL
jgi:hypothetical protein